jgi:hypothetical protein
LSQCLPILGRSNRCGTTWTTQSRRRSARSAVKPTGAETRTRCTCHSRFADSSRVVGRQEVTAYNDFLTVWKDAACTYLLSKFDQHTCKFAMSGRRRSRIGGSDSLAASGLLNIKAIGSRNDTVHAEALRPVGRSESEMCHNAEFSTSSRLSPAYGPFMGTIRLSSLLLAVSPSIMTNDSCRYARISAFVFARLGPPVSQ